jgi:hypothetical protein
LTYLYKFEGVKTSSCWSGRVAVDAKGFIIAVGEGSIAISFVRRALAQYFEMVSKPALRKILNADF